MHQARSLAPQVRAFGRMVGSGKAMVRRLDVKIKVKEAKCGGPAANVKRLPACMSSSVIAVLHDELTA